MKPFASAGPPRADARAGFVLIEVLAALTIGVPILALVAQFTSQSLRNWNRGESTIAVMEMLTTGLGRLKTDLTHALPMHTPGSDSSSVMFSGTAGQLLFVAATGFGAGDRGLELISVTVTREEDGIAVVRQRGPVTTGPTPLRDPVILLRGRMQFQFAYRDANGQLQPNWSDREALPQAVVINLANNTGTSIFPVPVEMKLPANIVATCITGDDDGTGGCPTGQQRPQRPPGSRAQEGQ